MKDSAIRNIKLADKCADMLATAREALAERVPESGWFKNFCACNWDTGDLFEDRFDFSIFVGRDESVPGNIIVGVSMIEVNHPVIDASMLLRSGNKAQVLDYLQTEQAKNNLQENIKKLMENYYRYTSYDKRTNNKTL